MIKLEIIPITICACVMLKGPIFKESILELLSCSQYIMFKSIVKYKSTKQHVRRSVRVNELNFGLAKIENHKWPSLILFLYCFSIKYFKCVFCFWPHTGNRRSICASSRSNASHLLHIKQNFSLVCKSCTITNLRNQEALEP